ncbi:hypothetical protein BE17_37965 [Sorangium cellulosum]|uniref:Uncharacterized protein n=1 Tax=Sorangium cellulosum TaxID=56 RepID=A0A150R7E4_SORCE|nr:hypothetical protein BE17_37965 [Sorangium cellulosum]
MTQSKAKRERRTRLSLRDLDLYNTLWIFIAEMRFSGQGRDHTIGTCSSDGQERLDGRLASGTRRESHDEIFSAHHSPLQWPTMSTQS